jgi:Homeodomain-like domain
MKTPIPPIHETPAELKALLTEERDAQKPQRLQALYLLQTQQARARRQVARLLGVHRDTVGRWLTRAWRCWGLGRLRHLLDVHIRIPSLEYGAQFSVQCLDSRLQ